MSTTSKKDAKELTKDLNAMETALNSLTYSQLADLLKEKKEKEIEAVQHKLKEARGIVEALEQQLVNLGVVVAAAPVTAPAKRAYTRNAKGSTKPAKATKKAKGKRGAVGEAIFAYLATKGAKGAHVNDIAAAVGNKPANITAFFYAGAGKKQGRKVAPNTFALKK